MSGQRTIEIERLSREEYAAKIGSGATKDPAVIAIEDRGETKIFFDTKKFSVDAEAMQDVLNSLVCNGHCSGYDIRRILYGDIWVYFNPIHHETFAHQHVLEKVVEELRRVAIDIEEDDNDDDDIDDDEEL